MKIGGKHFEHTLNQSRWQPMVGTWHLQRNSTMAWGDKLSATCTAWNRAFCFSLSIFSSSSQDRRHPMISLWGPDQHHQVFLSRFHPAKKKITKNRKYNKNQKKKKNPLLFKNVLQPFKEEFLQLGVISQTIRGVDLCVVLWVPWFHMLATLIVESKHL